MHLAAGDVIARFEVLELLGEGGMARVYRVRDRADGAERALKVLRAEHAGTARRLRREARAQQVLDHPNIVKALEVVDCDGTPALLMELVEGPTLQDHLRGGLLSIHEVDRMGRELISAVAAAHDAGHLHRDLKTSNVLLSRAGPTWHVRITDFGLTKIRDSPPDGSTLTGMLMGTPGYMSPEQARDAKNVDERADVFSLGCVLYELATGARAYDGDDRLDVLVRVIRGAHESPARLRAELPPRIVAAIEGCLQPRLDDRLPDCDSVLGVWTGARAFEPPRPRVFDPTTLPSVAEGGSTARSGAGPFARGRPRGAVLSVVGAVVTLALLGGALFVGWGALDTQPPTVLATDPPDGATGVRTDRRLTIRFDEPMDRAATERALATSVPGTTSWSDDGRELQVELPTIYAEGDSTRIAPRRYSYRLSTGARDVAGNPLRTPIEGSFTTARRVLLALDIHANLYGNSFDDGVTRYAFLGAGDVDADDLSSVATWHRPNLEVLEVESALLRSVVHKVDGDLEPDRGAIWVEAVDFRSFAEGFTAEALPVPRAELAVGTGEVAVGAEITADLGPIVREAHRAGRPFIQVRFRFSRPVEPDGQSDSVYFRRHETSLLTSYLAH